MRLAGKRALITGAAQGIGAAIAAAFEAEGARVLRTDINADAQTTRLDVCCEADWHAALAQAQAQMAGLDILVNNAGLAIGGTIEHLSLDAWRAAFAVNTDGAFLGCKHALPLLAASQSAAIINVASAAAVSPRPEMAAYGASKAALVHLTKTVALYCAAQNWDIRANALLPAFVDTDLIDAMRGPKTTRAALVGRLAAQVPLGRIAQATEIAAAAVYLASDESRFMTGAEMRLDGGMTV